MVWPILISVDVMPRISAALDAGEAGNASAASPASIGTTRIDLPPCLFLASAAGIGPRRAVRQDVRDSRAKQSLPRGSSASRPALRRRHVGLPVCRPRRRFLLSPGDFRPEVV